MTRTTIAAVATAPGRGGVGIVRVSGPKVSDIARRLLGKLPQPRYAHYGPFFSADGEILDHGIALFFPNPHSFTGEDVLELQGHGGPVVLDCILQAVLACGAQLAKPGEFTERAFLNDKIDLTQAEAIADLIEASSVAAAKQAVQSLQGAFSKEIHALVEDLIHLRMYVEASIDFPEEEVDFLSDGKIAADLDELLQRLDTIFLTARQGVVIRDGMKVVIAGRPNAGKSSLLNALAERDIAIVTDIAGTTRDVLKEHIQIDGMPLHIFDTAGLRESDDAVEQIGIQRAWQEIASADRILLLVDASASQNQELDHHWNQLLQAPHRDKLTLVFNKSDRLTSPFQPPELDLPYLLISAKTGAGLQNLKDHLKQVMSFQGTLEGGFSARRRHLDALQRARDYLLAGRDQLQQYAAGELLAEDLRRAQESLGEITGAFSSDDLLGRIFSGFCIGK
ncbi:tRNA uridine-5-carboxymethylaminomethyl(34) synthesis GTPase MnmE [Saccharophagus sp. K07]|uniref:tRNA uridine-5-carboxymethylaminomethyl(34) synthesis GTPase MnmE n=1 Tax=Saccharophagus sp. K07 TaxID=2283636 RepID=UPI001651EB62|nr:tRNA uridine-5-carboxymethylaminomethyl(34) synthesis GTPase MnmE [Saccharophagus sp. K07]MBC6906134.1 tRNA uridine-5-carboxymethylaminomethyl(34) synthesis GTPase MnmE [Saccharophagus sp. K07]